MTMPYCSSRSFGRSVLTLVMLSATAIPFGCNRKQEKTSANKEMMNSRFDNKQPKDNNSGKDW